MTFRRKRGDKSFAPRVAIKARLTSLAAHAKSIVSLVSFFGLAFGICLHGFAVVRAQTKYEPRISACEKRTADAEAVLKTLDQVYVTKALMDERRVEREKREAERDKRLERLEGRIDHIDSAITVLATRPH